jgi:hypothetical protein
MWYNRDAGAECSIAFAESDDGVKWITPDLGIIGPDNRRSRRAVEKTGGRTVPA